MMDVKLVKILDNLPFDEERLAELEYINDLAMRSEEAAVTAEEQENVKWSDCNR